jgi:hypothetical protein
VDVHVAWSTNEWARAIAALPRTGPLPGATVFVPRAAVAHALRKELVRLERRDVLCDGSPAASSQPPGLIETAISVNGRSVLPKRGNTWSHSTSHTRGRTKDPSSMSATRSIGLGLDHHACTACAERAPLLERHDAQGEPTGPGPDHAPCGMRDLESATDATAVLHRILEAETAPEPRGVVSVVLEDWLHRQGAQPDVVADVLRRCPAIRAKIMWPEGLGL